jgi:hypothetical protein
MDIDAPPDLSSDPTVLPHHTHLNLPSFSLSFPLPFRVLFLIGLAQLLWATNLHILHLLGLDTSWILDIKDPPDGTRPSSTNGLIDRQEGGEGEEGTMEELGIELEGGVGESKKVPSGSLYGPVYKIFLGYSVWVGLGWATFRWMTDGDGVKMERWRGLVVIIALGAVLGVILPYRGIGERERMALLR